MLERWSLTWSVEKSDWPEPYVGMTLYYSTMYYSRSETPHPQAWLDVVLQP